MTLSGDQGGHGRVLRVGAPWESCDVEDGYAPRVDTHRDNEYAEDVEHKSSLCLGSNRTSIQFYECQKALSGIFEM